MGIFCLEIPAPHSERCGIAGGLLRGERIVNQLPKNKYRWLLLPCLNKVREFDGKLLLAATAAERGWGVIVGYKGFVNLVETRGAVIEMSFKSGNLERHARIGRKICAWDEEGLVFPSAEDYCQRRLLESSIRRLDMAFLWGQNQKEVIQTCRKLSEDKFRVTGNPRFDMLRPDLVTFYARDVKRLTERYGRFVLLNTNFATVNEYRGREFTLQKLKDKQTIITAEQEQDQRARERYEAAIMRSFVELMPILSEEFRDHTILIRPHPSEDFDAWRTQTQGLSNVSVVHEGDVTPWLLAARVTIHNSCTTGVQSYLLGKPAVAYKPLESALYDKDLPNSLSIAARNAAELVGTLKAVLSGKYVVDPGRQQEMKRISERNVEGMSGSWASERVLDALEALDIEPEPLKLDSSYMASLDNLSKTGVRGAARTLAGGLHSLFAVGPRAAAAAPEILEREKYVRQTFPRLSLVEVRDDLERLRQTTGRFSRVEVHQTGEDHVCLHPSER
jgi:surface carbohydrate biosynthesis protein